MARKKISKKGQDSLDRINARYTRFVELYCRTGNAVEAAIGAGYSENYAKAQAYLIARRVQIHLSWAIRVQGVNEVELARDLIEARGAMKRAGSDKDGKPVWAPDWKARLEANKALRELLGYYTKPDEDPPAAGEEGSIQVDVIRRMPDSPNPKE